MSVAIEHARRSKVGEVEERERPREATPEPPAVQAALRLQQTSGNQALARMLSRTPRTLARFDHEFIYGPGDAGIQKGSVAYDENERDPLEACRTAAERVIEEDLGGIEELWLDTSTNSTADWAKLVYSLMEDRYTLEGIDESVVARAIAAIKDEHRARELLRVSFNLVYSQAQYPWSAANLAELLLAAGVYLEYEEAKDGTLTGPDGPAVERIFETEGAYAVKKIEFDEAKNELLLDADDAAVLIDHHQNKHQHPDAQITKFGQYEGAKGTKFASHKDLEWHRTNTAETVKQTVLTAVRDKTASQEKDVAPSKDPIDGIVYDLLISFDKPSGKWVGSYHCNPVVSEFYD
jgi:hypothetical protein